MLPSFCGNTQIFFVENGVELRPIKIRLDGWKCNIRGTRWFRDVPKDKKMWVIIYGLEFEHVQNRVEHGNCAIVIHLHSVEDINGGGWRKKVGKN